MDEQAYAASSVDYAAALAGGYDALASRMGVEEAEVVSWALARSLPSATQLLLVLEIIQADVTELLKTLKAGWQAEAVVKRSSDIARLA
jgi:hypothetical protein